MDYTIKIKEISNTIDIFKTKYDVIQKVKKLGTSTIFSTLMAVGIGVGISALSGAVAIPTIATVVPTAAYIGLSGLIRMPFQKTRWEELLNQYEKSDEQKKKIRVFLEENIINNQEYMTCIQNLKNIKQQNLLRLAHLPLHIHKESY